MHYVISQYSNCLNYGVLYIRIPCCLISTSFLCPLDNLLFELFSFVPNHFVSICNLFPLLIGSYFLAGLLGISVINLTCLCRLLLRLITLISIPLIYFVSFECLFWYARTCWYLDLLGLLFQISIVEIPPCLQLPAVHLMYCIYYW
jgi:hypothetical protein